MKRRAIFPFAAVLIGIALLAPAMAQAPSPAVKPPAVRPHELAPDLAFGRSIALIRGHLLAGEELVAQRRWNEAYPHFSYPTEEIYGVIREQLRTYRTPPFDGALKALARAVKFHSSRQYPKDLAKVDAALTAADAGLKASEADWPYFTVAVVVEVVRTAANEYEDAIADGQIVHAVGYRTARGFILQADRMIEDAAQQLPPADAPALAEIRARVAQFKAAFATLNAPKNAPLAEATTDALVVQVERAFRSLASTRQI